MQACVPCTQHRQQAPHPHGRVKCAPARGRPAVHVAIAQTVHGPKKRTDVQSDVQRTRVYSPLSSCSERAKCPIHQSTTAKWPHRKSRHVSKTQLVFPVSQQSPPSRSSKRKAPLKRMRNCQANDAALYAHKANNRAVAVNPSHPVPKRVLHRGQDSGMEANHPACKKSCQSGAQDESTASHGPCEARRVQATAKRHQNGSDSL
jgi:hypothetical protein